MALASSALLMPTMIIPDLSIYSSFADLLASWLLDQHLSCAAAADVLGVSPSTVVGWRAGRVCPTSTAVRRVAPVLGVLAPDLQSLVDRSDASERPRIDATMRHAANILGVDALALATLIHQSRPVAAVTGS